MTLIITTCDKRTHSWKTFSIPINKPYINRTLCIMTSSKKTLSIMAECCYAECHSFSVSHVSPLLWVSLWWVSLLWMSWRHFWGQVVNCQRFSDGKFSDRLRAALERGNTPDTDSVNDAADADKNSADNAQKGKVGKSYWRGRLSTIDLFVLTSWDQLLFKLKI